MKQALFIFSCSILLSFNSSGQVLLDTLLLNDFESITSIEKNSREPFGTHGLKGEKLKAKANSIINDSLYITDAYDLVGYNSEKINWSLNPYNDNTWSLFFNSLLWVGYLNKAYEITNDYKYHKKSKEIINQWIKFHNSTQIKNSKYTWYDHSVALRSMHFIQSIENELISAKPDFDYIEMCLTSLYIHAEWMFDNNNYIGYNHSLFMDKALLQIAVFYPFFKNSNNWRKRAIKRATKSFFEDVTEDGVVKEHSINYHILVYRLYQNIFELVKNNLNADIELRFDRMNDVYKYMVQPNGKFPVWGESQQLDIASIDIIAPDKEFEYIQSKGMSGVKPMNASKVFKAGGLAGFRTLYDISSWQSATHIAFFSQYHSRVHKQSDDLSFTLYSLGKEILIDPGFWGYDKSELRNYLKTSLSHNTISINDTTYSTKVVDYKYSRITDWGLSEKYDYIAAEHNLYGQDIVLRRKLYFFKPNLIILWDVVEDRNNVVRSSSQNFNFNPDFEFENKKSGISSTITINDTVSLKIDLEQHNKPSEISITKYFSQSPAGLASYFHYEKFPIKQYVFKTPRKEFITSIYLTSESYSFPVINWSLEYKTGESPYIELTVNRKNSSEKIIINK